MTTSLRDALSEALGQSEEGTLAVPHETQASAPVDVVQEQPQETAAQAEARLRDEKGRFAKGEQQQAAPRDPSAAAQVQQATTRKPPSSWKKDYWQHWDKLGTNPELAPLQEYIEQRESDYAKGVSTYKNQWDQAQPVYEAMQQFMPDLQRHNIPPAQWITNLGNAHRTLAMGNPQQKLQMFAKLATDYGVPLQAFTQGGRMDPQIGHVTQVVSDLQREVQSFKTLQQQAEQTALQRQIDDFAKEHEHFEAVKPTMAGLLQSGVAPDLKTAYDKAVRLHDDIWQQEQARQAEAASKKRQDELAAKRRAAASPRSSSPTGSVTNGGAKKGLRDQISESFESMDTGRF